MVLDWQHQCLIKLRSRPHVLKSPSPAPSPHHHHAVHDNNNSTPEKSGKGIIFF